MQNSFAFTRNRTFNNSNYKPKIKKRGEMRVEVNSNPKLELKTPKMRQTQITINVELDENHVPENDLTLRWWCRKSRNQGTMISVWGRKSNGSIAYRFMD